MSGVTWLAKRRPAQGITVSSAAEALDVSVYQSKRFIRQAVEAGELREDGVAVTGKRGRPARKYVAVS
jgi:response regulator of citrate/malate metabolism